MRFPIWRPPAGTPTVFPQVLPATARAFYVLQCQKPIRKIAINPCMIPSKEILMLKDRVTGEPIKIDEQVVSEWKKLEEYKIYSNVFGIFGRQDDLFHYDENHNYKPLFDKLFKAEKENSILVDGKHSLEKDELEQGFFPAIKYFGIDNIDQIQILKNISDNKKDNQIHMDELILNLPILHLSHEIP